MRISETAGLGTTAAGATTEPPTNPIPERPLGKTGHTGHSSRVLADALNDYPYDCALITLNPARAVMDDPEDLDRFFRLAQEKEVGVIAMNAVERGALLEQGFDMGQLLPYVLSYPVSTAVVGIADVAHLEENVRIASAFEQLSEQEMAEIRALAQG
jgi:predicted aldo/keto reductase-like oxidoreductase